MYRLNKPQLNIDMTSMYDKYNKIQFYSLCATQELRESRSNLDSTLLTRSNKANIKTNKVKP